MHSPLKREPHNRQHLNGKRPADAVLVALTLLAALSIALAVYWTLGRIEAQIKQQMSHTLETVVATTREGIAIWANSTKDRVSVIARRPEVVADVETQARLSPQSLRGTA